MEWRFDATDPESIRTLRAEVLAYLRRHAAPWADLDGAAIIVSELLTNVYRHTDGVGWVQVAWAGAQAELIVRDVGPGFAWGSQAPEPGSVGGRGLLIAAELADGMEVVRREAGSSVRVLLPVERAPAVSLDPPRRRVGVLPRLEEATPGIGFERDAFLRALVVQLAATAGEEHGPDGLERLVAQVGMDVGGQMEEEYRRATGRTGPLTAEDLGACFVRLKAAIGGGFRVVSSEEGEVVLENDRCPFGPEVQHAPGLCRMTSSVFGGIAARTTGSEAVVDLEQRIAVGDRQCRVVVRFGEAAAAVVWGHRYQAPAPA